MIVNIILSICLGIFLGSSAAIKVSKKNDWHMFDYGDVNSTVKFDIVVNSKSNGTLLVTDLLRPGSRFAVYNNERFLGYTSETVFNNSTSTSSIDPNYTFDQDDWSSGKFILNPGFNNVSIVVIKSPLGDGIAALQIREARSKDNYLISTDLYDSQIPIIRNDLILVPYLMDYQEASQLCKSLNTTLVNIDNLNFKMASELIFEVLGSLAGVWIRSWNGQTWDSTLSITTSRRKPHAGSINIANPVDKKAVLCQIN